MCPTLCNPVDSSPPGSHPWDSPGKNTGVGCHFLLQRMKVKSEREVAQSCPTLPDPMDCSPPGSAVPGILQARTLEWVAISFCSNKVPLTGWLNRSLSHSSGGWKIEQSDRAVREGSSIPLLASGGLLAIWCSLALDALCQSALMFTCLSPYMFVCFCVQIPCF